MPDSNGLFGRGFRLSVLNLFLTSSEFFSSYSPFLISSYIPEPDLKLILNSIKEVRSDCVDDEIDSSLVEASIIESSGKLGIDSSIVLSSFEEVCRYVVKNESKLSSKLLNWIKRERVKEAFVSSIDDIKSGNNLDSVLNKIDMALSVGADLSSCLTFDDIYSIKDMYMKSYGDLTKTGFDSLDKTIGGGFAPGEVHVVMGEPKIGKTTFAVNVGSVVAASGKSVVHFTMELSELDIMIKYACRFSGLSYYDILFGDSEQFSYDSRMDRYRTNKINLHVKHYVSSTVDSMVMRSFISSRRSSGKIEDVGLVIVDYDDLICPVGGSTDSMYNDAGAVYSDLIKLGEYFRCPILTLAQPKREAWNKIGRDGEPICAGDLAHSARKAHNAWSISSLNKLSNEDYLLYVDIVRRGVGNCRINVSSDLTKALFKEGAI